MQYIALQDDLVYLNLLVISADQSHIIEVIYHTAPFQVLSQCTIYIRPNMPEGITGAGDGRWVVGRPAAGGAPEWASGFATSHSL